MCPLNAVRAVSSGAPNIEETKEFAEELFPLVFRTRFDSPGFALLSFASPLESTELRGCMVALKEALGEIYHRATDKRLVYLSMGRFDQQATTKFHLDGAPDESFLMLGYEPSDVDSELWIADYAKAAFDMELSPHQFISDFNPMFARGEQTLTAYSAQITEFNPRRAHILLINNSRLPFQEMGTNFQGVMHKAVIPVPQPEKHRIVNSTMLGTAPALSDETLAKPIQQDFIHTNVVSGKIG